MSLVKRSADPIWHLLEQEEERQQNTLDLIPSENTVSPEVRHALGSVLTNKYAEGQVGKRYYQGNGVVDEIEALAIARARQLFGAPFVNVQALSGAPANQAVYFALVKPGQVILGMDLASGGHLTFGQKFNFSGRYYQCYNYTVAPETQQLDYQQVRQRALEVKPQLLVAGTSAYPRDLDWKELRLIADEVGAYLLADISHTAGLVATGQQNNPVGVADVVTTTTHKTLRGPRGALIMTHQEELAKRIDRAVFPGLQGGPHINAIAAIAVALGEALQPEYKHYAQQILTNAKELATRLSAAGYQLVTGGTDNHLLLVDLRPQKIDGQEAALLLEQARIIANKNLIPFDPNPPTHPSGLRLGTPAVTTRGLKETEMTKIADWIQTALAQPLDPKVTQDVGEEVYSLCQKFPIYQYENPNR